jgi:rare lipoprotein A
MVSPLNPGVLHAMRAASAWSVLVLTLAGCAQQPAQQASVPPPAPTRPVPTSAPDGCAQVGMASWYRGSSRDRASPKDLMAAHRSLPFGTPVQVTVVDTGQSVVVRINDRGPFGREGRVIDLSRAAANQLGILRDGVARVRIEPVEWVDGSCPLQPAQPD